MVSLLELATITEEGLDDVLVTTSPDAARMREAMLRSIRWLDRCMAAHAKPESQNLFCIF
ncbi:hypothetical protein VE02_09474 [Pseudogymnoascus sp. 03VT05]|nr:hypothetical protein VE02_09474 [Pseudogymnoascus sp. 03VT05]